MNTLALIVALASSHISGFVSCFYAYLSYKKSKDQDKAWDAAIKLVSNIKYSQLDTGEDFADLYAELKYIRDNPDKFIDAAVLHEAMLAKKGELQNTQRIEN